jgi:hypothetical protein
MFHLYFYKWKNLIVNNCLWESLTYIVIKTEVIYYLVIEFLFFMDVDKIIYIFGN